MIARSLGPGQPVPRDSVWRCGRSASAAATPNSCRRKMFAETRATPGATAQADFYNERRWLSFDLLCRRVDTGHPLHEYLLESGIGESELAFFLEQHRGPDLLGLNYYVASDRYLDEDLKRYSAGPSPSFAAWFFRRHRGRTRSMRNHRSRGASAGGLAALSIAGRDHRGSSRLHRRRADAMARRSLGVPLRRTTNAKTFLRYDCNVVFA